MAPWPTWLLVLWVQTGPDLNSNVAKKHPQPVYRWKVTWQQQKSVCEQESGEAEWAGGGSEGANWGGEAIVGGVSKGKEEEEEEKDPQQVGREDGDTVGMLQSCADGRETHVVTEGVAKHWTHQVTCNTEEEETLKMNMTSTQHLVQDVLS